MVLALQKQVMTVCGSILSDHLLLCESSTGLHNHYNHMSPERQAVRVLLFPQWVLSAVMWVVQVVEWVLAGVRTEWQSPSFQAGLSTPAAFVDQYMSLTISAGIPEVQ